MVVGRLHVGEDAALFQLGGEFGQTHGQVFLVRDGSDQRIDVFGQLVPGGQADAVFVFGFRRFGNRVVYEDVTTVIFQLFHQVGDLGISQVGAVFFEGEAEDDDFGALDCVAVVDDAFDGLLRDVGGHAVVDAAASEDDLRVVAEHFGFVGEVVGIDADAVAANQAGAERQEVPFGAGGLQHFQGVDAETVEDEGEFVHQGDVEVALGVFDDLGGFGDFDAAGVVDAGDNDGFVEVADGLEGGGVIAGDDFDDFGDGAFFVAGIDPLGGVPNVEVFFPFHTGVFFQQGDADFFGGAGIDGGFIDDGGTLLHVLADRGGGADQGGEVGNVGFIDRGGHGDDDEVGAANAAGVGADGEFRRGFKVFAADFAGGVAVVLVVGDLGFREVEADGFEFLAEFNRKRKTYVAQADDCNDGRGHGVDFLVHGFVNNL